MYEIENSIFMIVIMMLFMFIMLFMFFGFIFGFVNIGMELVIVLFFKKCKGKYLKYGL